MIRHQFHPTGRALLSIALTACVAACGASQTTGGGGHSTAASSKASSPPTTPTVATTTPTVVPTTPTAHTTVPIARVTIPVVMGDDVLFADQIMMSKGLGFVTESVPNLQYPYNVVVATNPSGGTAVRTDSTVTLYVSGGVSGCNLCRRRGAIHSIMPDVCGLTYQQANTLLAVKGITLSEQVDYQPSSEPSGIIVGSIPAATARFVSYGPSAEAVIVTLSSGQTASPSLGPAPGSTNECSTASPPPSSPPSSSPGGF
jgi:hypothetical protein